MLFANINQAHLSTKNGEIVVYCQYVILGQVIPWRNPPDNIDDHVSNNDHLVKMYVPLCDNNDGRFQGVEETVGYIMLRGDRDEFFWTYSFSEEKSNILYCSAKQPMPNVFKGTVSNAYGNEMLNERDRNDYSKIFFYLPSITDRKEKINQYRDQVSLTPIDCKYESFGDFAPSCYQFDPSHLRLDHVKYADARATTYAFFKKSINISNSNLIQNVYSLMQAKKIDHSDLKWEPSMPQCKRDSEKFKLGY